MATKNVKVWDIGVRTFHWTLVLLFFISYLTGDDDSLIHVYSGYAILGLVLLRIVWGVIGTKHARFTDFVYGRATAKAYVVSILKGRPIHYLGHNPLGGWMVVTLLIFLLLTTWTGLEAYGAEGKGPLADANIHLISPAMADDDEHHGKDSIWEDLHEGLANFTLFLVILHILGVIFSSLVHRENLVKAMIDGKKQIDLDETDRSQK
ncbi:MAG: cytochrome b/b6 domain-containing protein [Hydrogenovibrio sp.]|nr:cytochrome b/b6 domain-containing protein [Hydrogenovibrio sp.]